MKNFKRVISAVIALALSASTLVAVSASKFADVDNADSYAGAINTLTALDIIHGYEEEGGLVFKPEGDITRAEAATMIVGALNMTKDAQAAAGTSKFTDVNEKASWASGYVNVGVAQGFINGMDDTTFAPQENVTYAQMCVMLTLITGYGDYAKAYGGYPTGYTTIAAQTGINKGVAVAADTPLKRGQVAQVLYNAMVTPVLGVKNYSLQGNEYAVSDGGDIAFKTILSDKFTGFEAELKIDNVPKSLSSLEKNEAQVSLTEDTFLDEVKDAKITAKANFAGQTVIDDFGVSDYLYNSGKGILVKDNNKKWHLVYFEADENDTVSVDAADYVETIDGGKSVATNKKVTFGTKDYAVNPAGDIFVNGQNYGAISDANLATVLPLAQGEVKFIDDDTTVGAEGYDKIMVTSYTIAKVAAATYTNETTSLTITTKAGLASTMGFSAIEITDDAVADGDVAITVKNADGEKVALSSIKKGDIIGFAIDPGYTNSSASTKIQDPGTIDIIVTDETISGKVTAQDTTEKIYTIDGTDYEEVVWDASDLTVGSIYTLTLDPFGRIYGSEIENDSARYAIAEKYDSDLGVQLILPNGTAKYYDVEASTADLSSAGTAYSATAALAGSTTSGTFENYIESVEKNNPDKRVVKYTLKNSTGKISSITLVGYAATTAEYKARNEKLGGKSIIDSTAVIDASKYVENTGTKNIADYATFATSSFVDKTNYKASIFTVENTTAAFVVLTEVGKTLTADSRFAVVRVPAVQALTEDGDTCYKVGVLYEGEEQDLLFEYSDTDVVAAKALKAGDAFFFVTDNEGLVKSYLKVFDKASYANNSTAAFTDFAANNTGTNGVTFTYEATDKSGWNFDIKNSTNKDIQLVYGIVTDTEKGVEFATQTGGFIDLTNNDLVEGYSLDSDCLTYRYGIKEQTALANQYKAISVSGPTASTIDGSEVKGTTGADATTAATKTSIYNLAYASGYDHLTYALALIVDGDVVEIYTIVQ